MIEVRTLATVRHEVYAVDDIPLLNVLSRTFLTVFCSKYVITPTPSDASLEAQLSFANGVYATPEGAVQIDNINIDQRKVTVRCQAPTSVTSALHAQVMQDIYAAGLPGRAPMKKISCIDETTAVVRLPFEFSQIMNTGSARKVFDVVSKSYDKAGALILPSSIRFKIKQLEVDTELTKNNVSVPDMFITIEQREPSDPADCLYYTVSPLDSDAHFRMLESIVESLSGK